VGKLSTVIGCVAIAVLLVGTCCPPACAQVSVPTVLEIDIENVVEYQTDMPDLSRAATSPGVTPSAGTMIPWVPAVVVSDIVAVNGEPLIAHASDSKLVTASNPVAPGETLVLFATGLGPTVPGVDFGQPFSSKPAAVQNSPLKVT